MLMPAATALQAVLLRPPPTTASPEGLRVETLGQGHASEAQAYENLPASWTRSLMSLMKRVDG